MRSGFVALGLLVLGLPPLRSQGADGGVALERTAERPPRAAFTVATALGHRLLAGEIGLRTELRPRNTAFVEMGIGGPHQTEWPAEAVGGRSDLVLTHVRSRGGLRAVLGLSGYARDGRRGAYYTAAAGLQRVTLRSYVDENDLLTFLAESILVGRRCWICGDVRGDIVTSRSYVLPTARFGAGYAFGWSNGQRLELGLRGDVMFYGRSEVDIAVDAEGSDVESRRASSFFGGSTLGIAVDLKYVVPLVR